METSRLQTAANDLRKLQEAIAVHEVELAEGIDAVEKARQLMEYASANYREAIRNVADTRSFLNAQRQKLSRDLEEMRELTYRTQAASNKTYVLSETITCGQASEGQIRTNY